MAVFFWYLLKSDLSSVRYFPRVHQTSHFYQGTRKTRTYLTGHLVEYTILRYCNYTIFVGVIMLVISATQIYRYISFKFLSFQLLFFSVIISLELLKLGGGFVNIARPFDISPPPAPLFRKKNYLQGGLTFRIIDQLYNTNND